MHWYGKLLGAIAGALLFRPNPVIGAALGLLVGHAFDAGWFSFQRREDPYRELGLTRDATDAEVELAYRRLISQYHPDKVVGATPELRARAEQKASRLNTAYDRIRTLRKR
ncbi:DnaJ domain-containing protein [Xanthomonas sp. AmX2]|uniref:J domain-containing protein n=1 Tax=Xanthomonas sp. TaxID=29446 RepID=UPI00198092CA|nr:DnaJ domain-containing protein [Xanthomonas sp.]MBN6151829.1 DnaJ domain-containing protein [Xanthomonas sp.]